MAKALPLDKMSIEEKLQTMESIWDDLVGNADTIPSPDWHKGVLSEREEGVSNGSEEAIYWRTAKNKIKIDIK